MAVVSGIGLGLDTVLGPARRRPGNRGTPAAGAGDLARPAPDEPGLTPARGRRPTLTRRHRPCTKVGRRRPGPAGAACASSSTPHFRSFALLLCGYFAVRCRFLDLPAARGINAFVFWLALPALLLARVAGSSLPELLDWRVLTAFYGVNACLFALTYAIGRAAWKDPPGTAAIRALGVIWGNYGYLGLPLLTAALGPEAALPTVAVITCDILLPASLTIALLEGERGGGGDRLAALRQAAGGIVRNPLVIAVVVGALPRPPPFRCRPRLPTSLTSWPRPRARARSWRSVPPSPSRPRAAPTSTCRSSPRSNSW